MPPASRPPAETRRLSIDIDGRSVDAAAAALGEAVARRRGVAVALSGELEADRLGGADVRTGALQVVKVLGEADALATVASLLEAGWDAALAPPAAAPAPLVDLDKLRELAEHPTGGPLLQLVTDASLSPTGELEPSPVATEDGSEITHATDPDVAAAMRLLSGLDRHPQAAAALEALAGPIPPPAIPGP